MSIIIEATGCDGGFEVVLEGARGAFEEDRGLKLILAAGKDKLPERYSGMREIDGIQLRLFDYTYNSRQPKSEQLASSIYGAMKMHKQGEAEAVIAPGDTRGSVVSAIRTLGLIENVLSPAIATHWPRTNVLIDSGANSTEFGTTPETLLQFAIFGKVYSQNYLGVKHPLIGLLNMGHEDTKGNRVIRRARRLLDKLGEDYNLSPDYFEPAAFGDFDGGVVGVIGGFSGNIGLKFSEMTLKVFYKHLEKEIRDQSYFKQVCAKIGLTKPLVNLKRDLNPDTYATAPLLGIEGNVLICHGGAKVSAITNAVLITKDYLTRDVNSKLREEINKYGKL